MSTDKSAAAIREFAETIYHTMNPVLRGDKKMEVDYIISDLTALISEGYVDKDIHDRLIERADELTTELEELKLKYDELLQQRDELREALNNACNFIKRTPLLKHEEDRPRGLERWERVVEAAIKNTDG